MADAESLITHRLRPFASPFVCLGEGAGKEVDRSNERRATQAGPFTQGDVTMTRILTTIDEHPRLITAMLGAVILFFLLACLLNDVIPICHWLFGCDHRFHN